MAMECAEAKEPLCVLKPYQERRVEFVEESRCDLDGFWKSRTLYLTFNNNTRILGIRPNPISTQSAGGVGTASIVCDWNMPTDQYPVGMGILKRNAKVYMLGGCYPNQLGAFYVVYEFDNPTEPGGSPSLRPSDDLPELCGPPMIRPFTFNVEGYLFLLNGGCRSVLHRRNSSSFCFKALRSLSNHWFSVNPPCHLSTLDNAFVIGNRLCVQSDGSWKLHALDLVTFEWLDHGDARSSCYPCNYQDQAITLSISPEERRGYSVIITSCVHSRYSNLVATLVDDKGNMVATQDVTAALPGPSVCAVIDAWPPTHIISAKLIKLEENDSCSSRFCYVFNKQDNIIGFSVVKVSFIQNLFKEGIKLPLSFSERLVDTKLKVRCTDESYKDDFQWFAGYEFLTVEVVEKHQYVVDGVSNLRCQDIDEAFFN